MEAFLVSFGFVALAELGDKTQFLALMLASRFHRPMPILAGILVAVLVNHLASAALGYFLGMKLEGPWLKWIIAASFFAVAIWAVIPEKAEEESASERPVRGVRRDGLRLFHRRAGRQDRDRHRCPRRALRGAGCRSSPARRWQ